MEKRRILTQVKNKYSKTFEDKRLLCFFYLVALFVVNPNLPIGWDVWVIPVYVKFILTFADIPV